MAARHLRICDRCKTETEEPKGWLVLEASKEGERFVIRGHVNGIDLCVVCRQSFVQWLDCGAEKP